MPSQEQTTSQILRGGLNAETGSPKETEKALIHIGALVKAKVLTISRIGNTVFTSTRITSDGRWLPKTESEIHMYTAEGMQEVMQRLAVLPNTLRSMGIQKAYTYAMQPAVMRVIQSGLQKAGLQPNVTTQMKYVNGQMVPAYILEVALS
jgi:hypothetical protein